MDNLTKIVVLIIISLNTLLTFGQNNELTAFENLLGKSWKATGTWTDGSDFYQEEDFNFALDSAIIVTNSIGYINKDNTEIAERNHGVIRFNKQTEQIEFLVFDVFGDLTTGNIIIKENNFFYNYKYGEYSVTDMWEYKNDSTYIFRVGEYNNNQWKQVYLNTEFRLIK